MKTVVIANPRAGGGKVGRRWARLQTAITAALGPAEPRFTEGSGHATTLTRQALAEGFERVLVVGGDGTVNEVVNGFFGDDGSSLAPECVLGVISAGTGGDFARSVGLCDLPTERLLAEATVAPADVGRAELMGHDGRMVTRHFLNISSLGSSGVVVDMVNHTTKRFGAKASFLWGTVKGLLRYENQPMRVRVDGEVHEGLVNIVAIANGRYFGGAMKVAPGALVDDGLFDVVIVGDVGLGAFLGVSRKLYRGEHLGHPAIRVFQAREVSVETLGTQPVLLDMDGEQPGRLPVSYRILPGALKLMVPWSRAEATTQRAVGRRVS
jgi:YegS/Rv2252/BmrU family lipid kinase